MSVANNQSRFKEPLVHPTLTTKNVHILDVFKITKHRGRSEYDLNNIDFDNIVMKDVKYTPSMFDGDVIFILPPIDWAVPLCLWQGNG